MKLSKNGETCFCAPYSYFELLTGIDVVLNEIVPQQVSPNESLKYSYLLSWMDLYISVNIVFLTLQGETREQAFLGQMNQELENNTDAFLPAAVS